MNIFQGENKSKSFEKNFSQNTEPDEVLNSTGYDSN